jgi:hypothetical protein
VVRMCSSKPIGLLLVCWLSVLCMGARCGSKPDTSTLRGMSVDSQAASNGRDSVYYLDFRKPVLQKQIDSATARGGPYKFVQIVVSGVTNPEKRALTFDVSYQPPVGEGNRLGSFSLYPADNPGRFLIPTLGKVKEGGTVVVSLTSPDSRLGVEAIKVEIRSVRLVNR